MKMHGLESEMYNLLFVVTKLYLKRCLKHRFFIYYHQSYSIQFGFDLSLVFYNL